MSRLALHRDATHPVRPGPHVKGDVVALGGHMRWCPPVSASCDAMCRHVPRIISCGTSKISRSWLQPATRSVDRFRRRHCSVGKPVGWSTPSGRRAVHGRGSRAPRPLDQVSVHALVPSRIRRFDLPPLLRSRPWQWTGATSQLGSELVLSS